MTSTNGTSRPLTGRTVLFCLLGFFGTVSIMNGIMIRAAVSSFGGVETESAYKAGLTFKNDIAAAQAQDARGWAIAAVLEPENETTRIVVSGRDARGLPLSQITAEARLQHPTDRRHDLTVDLVQTEPGKFIGQADVTPGQWDLVLELKRDDKPVFRSRNRVNLTGQRDG